MNNVINAEIKLIYLTQKRYFIQTKEEEDMKVREKEKEAKHHLNMILSTIILLKQYKKTNPKEKLCGKRKNKRRKNNIVLKDVNLWTIKN